MMLSDDQDIYCSICGRVLTLANHKGSYNCTVPSHWQAAGLLSAEDYYSLAQLAARATTQDEQNASHPLVSDEVDY